MSPEPKGKAFDEWEDVPHDEELSRDQLLAYIYRAATGRGHQIAVELARRREDIYKLIDVAHSHGWNGVENPKALWDFFDARLSGQAKPNLEPEAGAVVSAMAGALLNLMDESPGVVNFLGMELVEKDGKERRIQVTLQYVKPGVKTPEQRASELAAENEILRKELATLRGPE